MKEGINKELVFKFFSGKATVFEKEIIDQWASEPDGKELIYIWLLEWENQNLQYHADVDNGLSRHWSRITNYKKNILNTPEAPNSVRTSAPYRKRLFLVAAAIGLVVLGLGLFSDDIRYETFSTDFGEMKRIELEDGSKVVLNSNSLLKIPRFTFGKEKREVYLSGEADFNVSHTKDHKRFVVHATNRLDIEVLGTQFNVYSRQRGSKVVLNQGSVQLHYLDGKRSKRLIMKPGDLVSIDPNGYTNSKKTHNPENFSAWKAHRFIFENVSLQEICNLFEDNFGVKVMIPDSGLAKQTISGSFTALNAEELLEILTDGSGLSYKKSDDGKMVTLSY